MQCSRCEFGSWDIYVIAPDGRDSVRDGRRDRMCDCPINDEGKW